MVPFTLICYLAAFLMFVLSALDVGSRVHLVSVGLACWVLAHLVGAFPARNRTP